MYEEAKHLSSGVTLRRTVDGPNTADHPVLDLLLSVLNYALQLVSLFMTSPCELMTDCQIGKTPAAEFEVMLMTSIMLSMEVAVDALDQGGRAVPRTTLQKRAYWTALAMSFADSLLLILMTFFSDATLLLIITWVFCFLTTCIAPVFTLTFRVEQCLSKYASTGYDKRAKHYSA